MPNTVIQRRLITRNPLDPVVLRYINLVMPALGLTLEPALIRPFDKFVKGCRKDGIFSKMLEWNLYLTSGNLAIAGTPQQLGPTGADSGLYQWSNRGGNFVNADVTINGVAGDAANKGFVTGIRPTGTFSSADSAGLTVYVSTHTTVGYDAGGFSNGNAALFGIGSDSGGTFNGDCWDAANTSSLTPASPGLAGFYSISRTASNVFRSYFANSTNAFAQQASNATPSGQTWFGGAGNNNLCVCGVEASGLFVAPTARRQSFFCAHEGLTAFETQLLYNRVQSFLMAKGGGFV